MEILAVFKNRSDAIKVARRLLSNRIPCATVTTPSYLKLGCGLSVTFKRGWEGKVKGAIEALSADSFYGFFARN